MKNKYLTEAEDIALGLEMHEVESQPFEARLLFYVSPGEYPQMGVCIELRDGLDRHWLGESDSYPICYGIGKYEAVQRLKWQVKRRHPNIRVIKSDYSEIKRCFPTYIKEYCKYRRKYYWVGTWMPV